MRQFNLLTLLLVLSLGVQAQLATNQSAVADDPSSDYGCYLLTPAELYQKGSVFSNTPINLTQNFELYTRLFFGTLDQGADGIAFVLQGENPTYLGNVGAGIGYHRFNDELPDMPTDIPGPVPSFIIEFDTYQNGDILGQDIADPVADHVGFMSNSNAYHTSESALKAPQDFATNIEDGQWHDVKFSWNASTKTMTVHFRISNSPLLIQTFTYTGDIVNTLLGGNPMAYWGFTASTGSIDPNEQKVCILPPPSTDCGQLRTQTPGGWGAVPRGNNPGTYLHSNFASAFPTGLVVGVVPGYHVKLTSAQAITNYLPAGGQSKPLTQNYLNPTTTSLKNNLVNHLVALSLSVRFDETDPAFGSAGINLGDMQIKWGAFSGWNVYAFLVEANKVLGGASTSFSVQSVLETASAINENYVDGTRNLQFLECPVPTPRREYSCTENSSLVNGSLKEAPAEELKPQLTVYPNPSNGQFELRLNGKKGSAQVLVMNASGVVVEKRTINLDGNLKQLQFDLSRKTPGIYMVRIISEGKIQTQKVMISK